MKKIIAILALIVALTACSSDLPPLPPAPGQATIGVGGAIAGLAGMVPNWAAEPVNVMLTPQTAKYGDGIIVTINDYDYIYKTGYYFDTQRRIWIEFPISGEAVEEWIPESAVASIPVTEQRFRAGENYLVVYACNKAGGTWDCNGNRWMLLRFNAEAPVVPETQVTDADQYIIQDIPPFTFQGMMGEPDNFESTIVTRYDGRYRDDALGLFVLTHVFKFDSRLELDETINTLFADIIRHGSQNYRGQTVSLFLDETDNRVAVWPSIVNGEPYIIYVETHTPDFASQEVIDAYLDRYPSDL